MDAQSLYTVEITIEHKYGTDIEIRENRTTEQILSDVDHFRFIAPLGSTLTVKITEA